MGSTPNTNVRQAFGAPPAQVSRPGGMMGGPPSLGATAGGFMGGQPQMGTVLQPGAKTGAKGVKQQYYQDINQIPATGGYMRPTVAPGQKQGFGLNWVVPPPQQQANLNPDRNLLASFMMDAIQRDKRRQGGGGNYGGSGGYAKNRGSGPLSARGGGR